MNLVCEEESMALVKSFSVGDGDMFYINHCSDNFTIIDCCDYGDFFSENLEEIRKLSKKEGYYTFHINTSR